MIFPGCASTAKKRQEQAQKTRELAEAYLREGNLPFAYRELMKAKELAPDDPHIHYNLGLFAYQRKNYGDAIKEYQKAIELKPDFSTAINNLGVVYMETEEWDKAIETLTPLTENYAYATPHFAHYLMGEAFFRKKNPSEAINHFQEAIELKPDYAFAYYGLGTVLLASGQTGQAITTLEEAVSLAPKAAAFHLDLGRAYLKAGQYRKAGEAAAQAASLATDPDLKQSALKLKMLVKKKTG